MQLNITIQARLAVFMQMTVMSEGLLLSSKYIKIGRQEGGFQAFLTQPPLVIVCHKLIIWRLTIYGSAMV